MKAIYIIADFFRILYFYSVFYLIIVLMTDIDILIKLFIIILLVLFFSIKSKIEGIIDFISSTSQIMSVVFVSVLVGLGITNGALKGLNYVILNSKYNSVINKEVNAALIILLLIILWFTISYFLFYFVMNKISKMSFKDVRLMVLNRHHYKVLEAGTTLGGFLPLLVSITITAELNDTINEVILGMYLLCLIPFLYFHFNEDLIEK